jgi:hypothetical protein
MMASNFFTNLTNELRSISVWEYRTIFCIVIVTTFGIALYTSYEVGYEAATDDNLTISDTDFPGHLNLMRASLAFAFAFGIFGIWLRKAIGFIILAVAMLWVGIAYAWWYFKTLDFFRGAEMLNVPEAMQEIGMFRMARWFDFLVPMVAVALGLWVIRILIRSLRIVQ